MGRAGPRSIISKIDGPAHQRRPMTSPALLRNLSIFNPHPNTTPTKHHSSTQPRHNHANDLTSPTKQYTLVVHSQYYVCSDWFRSGSPDGDKNRVIIVTPRWGQTTEQQYEQRKSELHTVPIYCVYYLCCIASLFCEIN